MFPVLFTLSPYYRRKLDDCRHWSCCISISQSLPLLQRCVYFLTNFLFVCYWRKHLALIMKWFHIQNVQPSFTTIQTTTDWMYESECAKCVPCFLGKKWHICFNTPRRLDKVWTWDFQWDKSFNVIKTEENRCFVWIIWSCQM